MPTNLYVLYENEFETRSLQRFIREKASQNDIECYDILSDAYTIKELIDKKDYKLRFLFIDVFETKDQYEPKLSKNLLHGLAWARNMRVFVTIKSWSVFGPSIRDSYVKYILTFESDQIGFCDPDDPEKIYRDIDLLFEKVNKYIKNNKYCP